MLISAILLAIAGCGPSDLIGQHTSQTPPAEAHIPQTMEAIRIGALFPLTGGLSQYGEAAQKTAQMAVDEINAKGGINGRRIELDVQDHQCDPKTAVSIFSQQVDAKQTRIFLSAACSGTAIAIAPILSDKKSVMLSTIVTAPKVSGSSKNLFRNWAIDASQAKLYAEHIKQRGYLKVGIINEETDYAQGLRLSLERYLNNSGTTVVAESFPSGTTDVRTPLAKFKDKGIDALFISPQTVTSGDIVLKQLQEMNLRVPLYVNDNILKSTDLLSRYKDILEGATSADYVMAKSQAYNDVLSAYKKRYGTDCPQTNICAGIHDAVSLLSQGIAAKGEDADGLRDYLSRVTFEGASGRITFDEKNDRKDAEYSLFTIKDGRAVLLGQRESR